MSTDELVTNFFGDEVPKPAILTRPWFHRHYPFSIVGAILLIANFSKLMSGVIDAHVANPTVRAILHAPIQLVGGTLATLVGRDPVGFFERSMACGFFLIGLYLVLLAAFSFRRRGLRMFAYGAGGIVIGVLALHTLAYAVLITLFLAKFLFIIVSAIVYVVKALLYFLFHDLWPVLALLAVAGAVFLAYKLREELLYALRVAWLLIRRNVTRLLAIAVVGWLFYLIYPVIYRWIIVPIIAFLNWFLPILFLIVGWIALVVGGLLAGFAVLAFAFMALAFVGSLAVTQLQAGWHAARSQAQALTAGIAIGSALALIVLVSVGTPALATALDQAWRGAFAFTGASHLATSQSVASVFANFLPTALREFAFTYLTNLQAPALDSFLLLATACLASLSVLFRLFSNQPVADEYVPIRLLAVEYTKMMIGVFALLFLIFAAALSGDSHNG
ncbi:MAG: hypothetical protein WDN08_09405 [Rhizomicrobium sp.]